MTKLITVIILLQRTCQNYILWGRLRSKKEAINNGDNEFQNALDDTLNYQNI